MSFKSSHPIVQDGKVIQERIKDQEIERFISQRAIDQRYGRTWWDEKVKLKDGREITIRTITKDDEKRY